MKRAVWTGGGLDVEDVDPPALAPGFARLQVEACGICGTDLQFWSGHHHPKDGSMPGHEFVGTLLDAPVGTPDGRYSASPMVRCGTCEHCLAGELNLCRRGGDLIGIGRNGGLAEWVDVPAENLVPLGDVSADVGVLDRADGGRRPRRRARAGAARRDGARARRRHDRAARRARRPPDERAGADLGALPAPGGRRRGPRARRARRVRGDGLGQAGAPGGGHRDRRRRSVGDDQRRDPRRPSWRTGGRPRHVRQAAGRPAQRLQKEVAILPSFAYSIRDGVSDFDEAAAVLGEHRDVLPAWSPTGWLSTTWPRPSPSPATRARARSRSPSRRVDAGSPRSPAAVTRVQVCHGRRTATPVNERARSAREAPERSR